MEHQITMSAVFLDSAPSRSNTDLCRTCAWIEREVQGALQQNVFSLCTLGRLSLRLVLICRHTQLRPMVLEHSACMFHVCLCHIRRRNWLARHQDSAASASGLPEKTWLGLMTTILDMFPGVLRCLVKLVEALVLRC
eukprot:jgi/Ulvmu1/7406/UM036_0066.1